MNHINQILNTDSYKFSHWKQYPEDTQYVYSYIEARGSKIPGVNDVVFFGLEAFKKDVLQKPITLRDVDEAEVFCTKHGVPFNKEGWTYIVKEHGGVMPISINAVREGTIVPVGNAMVTLQNTDPKCFWLTSYLETSLVRYVWYGSTVATISRELKKVIYENLKLTADDPDSEINFKVQDFGFRGVSSYESAGLGGAAHLINFMGTDTVAGILYAQDYYGADVCGFSIAASEHSTMTSWGMDSEFEAYRNMVDQYAMPGDTFACVIDSYNWIHAIDLWTELQPGAARSLLDSVKARGAKVILRPDSGDPIKTPVQVVEKLLAKVGFTINSKGFRVLPDHVRVIQGDGVDIEDVRAILVTMKLAGISGSNIGFGMGGGLLQKVNRDTFKFAMKCSAIQLENGKIRDVFKCPIGQEDKKSKKGVLDTIIMKDGTWRTTKADEASVIRRNYGARTALHKAYHAAEGFVSHNPHENFEDIRERAKLVMP